MKNKTDAMNSGYTAEEVANGFDKIPNSEMASQKDRKDRQLRWSGLDKSDAMCEYENTEQDLRDYEDGGFLSRNSYQGRF